MMILIFSSLALMVVQRQSVASRSASPWSTGQHVSFAPWPMPMLIKPDNKSTHAPSLRVSIGQVSCFGGDGVTIGGGGRDGDFGGGLGVTGGLGALGGLGVTGGLGALGGLTTGGMGGLVLGGCLGGSLGGNFGGLVGGVGYGQ